MHILVKNRDLTIGMYINLESGNNYKKSLGGLVLWIKLLNLNR